MSLTYIKHFKDVPGRWIVLRGYSFPVLMQHPKLVTNALGHPSKKSQVPHGAVWENNQLKKKRRKRRTLRKMEESLVCAVSWHFQFHAFPPGSLLYSKDTLNTKGPSKGNSQSSLNLLLQQIHWASTKYQALRQEYRNGGGNTKTPAFIAWSLYEGERGR